MEEKEDKQIEIRSEEYQEILGSTPIVFYSDYTELRFIKKTLEYC